MNPIIIAHPDQKDLAHRLADQLQLPMLLGDEVQFADSELRILINDDDKQLKNAHAVIVHSICYPVQNNLMRLLLICYALRQHDVAKISAVIPYFGYARQLDNPDGTKGAAHLVVKLLEDAGIAQIITVALHERALVDSFSIPVIDVNIDAYIAEYIKMMLPQKCTLVAPDAGAYARVQNIARMLSLPVMQFEKDRYDVNKVHIGRCEGDCNTPCALIIDDIIDTGETIKKVAKELKKTYDCIAIYAFGIHSVLSDMADVRLQQSCLHSIRTTNTIQLSKQKKFEKLHIVDISSELLKPLLEIL